MKPFEGFKSEASKATRQLPAGPYVAVIRNVKIDGEEPDQRLILRLDVAEGPYANYFIDRYNREAEKGTFEPKYKGDFRLRIPNENNPRAMYPDSDKRNFNDAIYRIEKSNPGYTWDWNERGLIGKIVGINMQEAEFNGNAYTRIGRLETADDVRQGIVQPMRPKEPRSGANNAVDAASGMTKVDEELPWDDGKKKSAANPYF